MMDQYIYAIELPNGCIKFGITTMLRERVAALRREFGFDIKPLGVARGGHIHETQLLNLLRPYRVTREVFHPAPLVIEVVRMMGPFPPVTPIPKHAAATISFRAQALASAP